MTGFSFSAVLVLALVGSVYGYNNGLANTPPRGWSTWCTDDVCGIIDKCTENEVLTVAEAMVSEGLKDLGYNYILMDDCWSAKTRNSTGHLQPDPTQFPHGMKYVADKLHAMGMYFGLYTCIGTETCHGGRPGSFGHYEVDAATVAEWGMDMIKTDNCHKPSGYSELELYTNFSTALNATGRPIVFALCEWGDSNVLEWGHTVGQMFRVQKDHIPLWSTTDIPWAQGAGAGFGGGTLNIINYMSTITPSKWIKQYGWLDVDFLETLENPIFENKVNSRTEFTFWSFWSSPLLVSTDLRNLTAEKREIIANPEVLAINWDPSWTAGDLLHNTTNGGQVWSRNLANGDKSVILFNPTESPIDLGVTWPALGWSTVSHVAVRDLWARSDVGNFTAGWNATVAKHDVSFVRLTPFH